VPYLYSDADVAALLAQATRLRTPLRVATIQTLIGLLSVDDTDFDQAGAVLTVRHAKSGKQRLIPLRPSTVDAMAGLTHDSEAATRNLKILSDAVKQVVLELPVGVPHLLVAAADHADSGSVPQSSGAGVCRASGLGDGWRAVDDQAIE
jgi:hypothetical protein